MDIKDTISGFKGVMEGKYDDLPEMAFYMVSCSEFAISADTWNCAPPMAGQSCNGFDTPECAQ